MPRVCASRAKRSDLDPTTRARNTFSRPPPAGAGKGTVRQPPVSSQAPPDLDGTWRLLLALAERARHGEALTTRTAFALAGGAVHPLAEGDPRAQLIVDPESLTAT